MIQLASDPNASRMNWRPAQSEDKAQAVPSSARTRHAWPFISRYAGKPAAGEQPKKPASSEHGS
jgi:hypothetical protein